MNRNLLKITLLLFLVSWMTGIGSCSQIKSVKLDPADPVAIECWHYYNGVQKDSFDKLILTFNDTIGREQGIQVTARSQGDVAGLADRLATAVNSAADGSALPDIFAAYADTAYDLARQGRLVALDTYLQEKDLAEFQTEFLNAGRFLSDRKLYILPLAKSSEVLVLNLTAWKAFAAANPRYADASASLASWESVGQAAEAYRNWSGQAMFGFDDLANFLIIGSKQLGIDLLQAGDGFGKMNFDRDTMHRIWDLYYVNTVQGGFATIGDYRSDDLASGQLIAGVMSTASGSWLPKNCELQVLAYPVFQDGQNYFVQQGAGLAVIQSTPRREAASVILLAWLTQPEQNVDFTVSAGYLPVTQPALQSQLLRDRLGVLGQSGNALCLNTFLNQMKTGRLYMPESFAGSYSVRMMMAGSLEKLAQDARQEWTAGLAAGTSVEKLYGRYVNEVIFEKWYSQLVLDAGRLIQQK